MVPEKCNNTCKHFAMTNAFVGVCTLKNNPNHGKRQTPKTSIIPTWCLLRPENILDDDEPPT